jgi:hypothetical protein
MSELHDINCVFSYVSSVVFIIGILAYIYFLFQDYRDPGERSNSDTVWIWGMFILLWSGLLVSSYCIYQPTKQELIMKKWAPKDPFNFIGKSLQKPIMSVKNRFRRPPIIRVRN